MKNPLVSIIIPTRNRPELLKIALESVLNQTYSNFEAVIVNDGGSEIKDLVNTLNDKRLLLFSHETNKGLSSARNTAILKSQGKYIAYLDDDDIYYPDHIETLVQALTDKKFQVAYTDGNYAFREKKGKIWVTQKLQPYSIDVTLGSLLVDNRLPPLSIMHEKACFEDVGVFDTTLRRHEDWDLWIRMIQKFPFLHVPKVTVEYSQMEGQMVSSWYGPFLNTMQILHHRYRDLSKTFPNVIEEQLKAREELRIFMIRQLERMSDQEINTLHVERTLEEIAYSASLNTRADIREAFGLTGYLTKRDPENAKLWLIHAKLASELGFYRVAGFAVHEALSRKETIEALIELAMILEKGQAPEEAAKVRQYIDQKEKSTGPAG